MDEEPLVHCIGIIKYNANWHRKKYLETKDRYHLGQWKAYSRVVKRFYGGRSSEAERIPVKDDVEISKFSDHPKFVSLVMSHKTIESRRVGSPFE